MGRWIPRRKKWLEGYVQKRKKEDRAKKSEYAVIYVPVRCPRCNTKNVRCYKSIPKLRYYKCRECGYNFKSIEMEG